MSIAHCTLALASLFSVARAGTAQDSRSGAVHQTIPYFALGESPLRLTGSARPGVFVSAVGRRAIAMGTEDGRLELWSWPIKWLHDLELSFQVPKLVTPLQGHLLAQSITERPEGVTLEYAYETFTVRQHVFVPIDEPAVVMLLEVDAVRPLDIIARFTPDIHYAWPAAIGGQYLVWDDGARAFLFSESKRKINAYLGSPAVTRASDVPAHMLAAEQPELVLGVGDEGDRYTAPRLGEPPGHNINLRTAYIPIVLAGGEMPRDSALAIYRRLTTPGVAERAWRARVAHADSIRETQFTLRSPDTLLDKAVEYAKVNLDEAYVCNPDLGCGMVAGYGLSGGSSDRPGFGWYFGGDAAINSLAMTGVGQTASVRQGVLRFFARYQRADGKITHEISQAAAKIPWFTEYPYAFYHGDTTPFWILAFGEYWKQTADTALVRELWPNLRKAYDWSRATDTDGDGLMENPAAGAGALEVGDLQVGIRSDVYLSGVWVAALDRFARMAAALGHRALADSALATRAKAVSTLESRLWLPSRQQYAFALLEKNQVNESLTAWPATAMSFDVFGRTRGAAMATRLASSEIMTEWGARPLAASSPLFDPLHYNNGAVWPFVTGWVALAQYRYHNAPAGKFALDAIARTTFDESRGRNPEVISGRLYKPLETAVPQQFFATSMVLTPLIRGLLGIDVDAPSHTLTIAPHLPPDWDSLGARNIVIGGAKVGLALRRTGGGMRLELGRRGAAFPIDVVFSPAFPLTTADSGAIGGDIHVTARGSLRDSLTLIAHHTGGWDVLPPPANPAIGDRSAAVRVLSERLVNGQYRATLEGQAGQSSTVRVVHAGVESDTLVTFPTSGANADNYTMTTLSMTATAPRVTKAPFGKLPDGTTVDGYTIRNDRGTTMHVITYGGIITSIRTADRAGALDDIVLGYDSLAGYLEDSPYFGAIVGRYANRIAKGRFTINGKTYQVPVNNGQNSLHGGIRGLDKVVWDARPFENAHAAGLVLSHVSPDGDQGYPGRLSLQVTYTLDDDNRLTIDYAATTDKATPINISQHSYFNLTGGAKRDILSHVLELDASRYTPVDSTLIPTGDLPSVAGTPFDFRTPTAIGARIAEPNEQLKIAGGYDHNFVLDRSGTGQTHAARVVEPASGRTLDVTTDQPGVQFYSGNFLDGTIHGKGGRVYSHRFGFCLETQHFPDSPNDPSFPSTILRPGQRFTSRTVFTFGIAR